MQDGLERLLRLIHLQTINSCSSSTWALVTVLGITLTVSRGGYMSLMGEGEEHVGPGDVLTLKGLGRSR